MHNTMNMYCRMIAGLGLISVLMGYGGGQETKKRTFPTTRKILSMNSALD